MGKLTMQDLAAILIEKNGLKKTEAKHFVTAIFDVIRDAVEKEKLVKVKGLGTFKVIDVDARESVNINTGGRVLIDGHSKITFTPDSTMKELVNKPFSSFETVVLNEGVEFDDEPVVEEPVIEEPVVDEPVTEEPVVEGPVTEEPVAEEPVVEEPVTEKPVVEEPVAEEPTTEEPVAEEPVVEEPLEEEEQTSAWWKWALVLILGICIGFALGYYVGKNGQETLVADNSQEQVATDTIVVAMDTLTTDSALVADSLQEQVATDTTAVATDTLTTDAAEPEYKKYDAMDTRVRLGAYYIDGLDQEVEARAGDNLAKVSRRYLGEGMSCYVEVYNGMGAKTELEAGQKIKIPKLRLRKFLKNKK
ncbi:MAG: HU family DNA-binding protein [Prevotella sp.]|nr:HU family DNA-binding protein [Prevotella sp.]